MKLAVRTIAELGAGLVLAPERHVVVTGMGASGRPLGELVVERNERVLPREMKDALVLDTTHVKEGVVDAFAARRATAPARSTKKRARPGDVLVSRLRPYLRQVALVSSDAVGDAVVAVSTEFYVLAPRAGEPIGWLVPWLLSAPVQEALAAAQEGGHHPRVPRASLFALRVPDALFRARGRTSAKLAEALTDHYAAEAALRRVLG